MTVAPIWSTHAVHSTDAECVAGPYSKTSTTIAIIIHCKKISVLSTLICPNTHTKSVLVCVLGQISVLNTLLFLQCRTQLIIGT